MRFLLFYKGFFGASLRGPEIRYLALAEELLALGNEVCLCGREGDSKCIPFGVEFILSNRSWLLVKAFLTSDVIVLHGGGPFVLFWGIVSGLLGKKIVLDAYAPQWIELDDLMRVGSGGSRLKSFARSYFNVVRGLLGGLVFNLIIVANKRQLDLFRGMIAPFTLTYDFSRVAIIPFGCSKLTSFSRRRGRDLLSTLAGVPVSHGDFLIGWLGGVYGWFDIAGVLRQVSIAIVKNPHIKIVFFGVDSERKKELLNFVDSAVHENIVFLQWVDFSKRFEYWSGFDVSLVWGKDGYENDYASRTRNFDCLTLGLPIVQNHDDEWGVRLMSGRGAIADQSSLADILLDLSRHPDKVDAMRASMVDLAPDFYWSNFAQALVKCSVSSHMSLGRRLVGVTAFSIALPAFISFFIFHFFKLLFERKSVDAL